jgi:hypothetical protein
MGAGCSSDTGSEHRSMEAPGTMAHRLAPPNMARRASQPTCDKRRRISSTAVTSSPEHDGDCCTNELWMTSVAPTSSGSRLRRLGSLSPAAANLHSQVVSDETAGGASSGRHGGRSPTASHQSVVVVPTSERADPWLDRTPLDEFEE